jgi:hypothetical protein
MGLLAPWFLAGLAAVGLPVWLHLLQQHKLDPVRFPSLQLFERRTESSIKQRRLKYRLLFALRALLLILLALMFAQPFLRRDAASAGTDRHVVLAVDRSLSMRAANGLEKARQQALAVAGGLGTRSAQVMELGPGVRLLTQPVRDAAEIKAAVSAIQPGDGRAAYAELARAVKTISDSVRVPVELHLFTDLQRTAAPTAFSELALPPGTDLRIHPVSAASTANFSVESVSGPRTVSDPKRTRIVVTVAGYGTPEAEKTVELVVNGRPTGSKRVRLGAGGKVAAEFIGLESASFGWNRLEARIDGADALPADDVFRFAMERADPRKVLFVHEPGKTRAATYFKSALESGAAGLFELEALSADQAVGADPSRYALCVLSDLVSVPAALETALKKYVQAGGGVLIAAGAASTARGTIPLTGARVLESRFASRADRYLSAALLDQSHPAVARAGKWEGVRFYQAFSIEPGAAAVVARLNDSTPLLTDLRSGEGRIMTFASGFENVSNDFPLHPSFVPFVEQTARHLAQVESRPSTVTVGSPIELRSAAAKPSGAVEVLNPRGERVLDLDAASSAQSIRVSEEGYYQITRTGGRRELVAVNADRAESRLEPMPEEAVEIWKRTGDASLEAGADAPPDKRPVSLWWYAALALFIVCLAESVVASRYLQPENA